MEKIGKVVLFAVRIAVSGTFIYAALGKIAHPDEFYVSISNYRILSGGSALLAAYFLPPLELLCGAMFLSGRFLIPSGIIMAALLFIFMAAILSASLRGLDISCGCFAGGEKSGGHWGAALRDLLLLASILAVLGFKSAFEFNNMKNRMKNKSK